MYGRFLGLVGALAVATAIASPAKANLIFTATGTATDGSALSATVDFSLTGNTFQIVLTNNNVATSGASVLTNLGILPAGSAPAPATSLPSSAGTIALTAGSSLVSNGTIDTTNLGQEWAYLTGGVASSGWGVGTGAGNLCGSANCNPSPSVPLDGQAFGLVGTGTDLTLSALKKDTYVENSVTIDILLAANSTFLLSDITGVYFQYGTGPDDGTNITSCVVGGPVACGGPPVNVPEPSTLALFGTALLALGFWWRRRNSL